MVIVRQFDRVRRALRPIGNRFSSLERKYALPCLRYSLAIVFFWFGIIKPLGRTPATMLVGETLAATPVLRTFVPFSVFMPVLGGWEAIVGLGLLFRRTLRLAVGCMMVQMGATFVPLFVVTDITFHSPPFFPTTPGFYVVKNFVLLSGGLVVASHFDGIGWRWNRVVALSKVYSRRHWSLPSSVAPLQRTTLRLLRAGLCLVFLWSGMLHLSGMGEMGGWIATVVQPLIPSGILVPLIGVLELSIGLGLVTRRTTPVAAYLAVVYLLLSLLPLLLRPALAFGEMPLAITFEGAYLIKDWVLVSAVFVVDRGEFVPS